MTKKEANIHEFDCDVHGYIATATDDIILLLYTKVQILVWCNLWYKMSNIFQECGGDNLPAGYHNTKPYSVVVKGTGEAIPKSSSLGTIPRPGIRGGEEQLCIHSTCH